MSRVLRGGNRSNAWINTIYFEVNSTILTAMCESDAQSINMEKLDSVVILLHLLIDLIGRNCNR